MKTEEQEKIIKETEEQFRESLEMWTDIFVGMRERQIVHNLRFNEIDAQRILMLFTEVTQNLMFFSNPVKSKKDMKQMLARGQLFGEELRKIMINFCGFDPSETK